MDENQKHSPAEMFESLKKTGFALEQQLNQLIQDLIDHENLVNFAVTHADSLPGKLKVLQQYVEILSVLLHFPTKDDIANVAKLTIQVEDKLDKLEEHLFKLTNNLGKIEDAKENVGPEKVQQTNCRYIQATKPANSHYRRTVEIEKRRLLRRWNAQLEDIKNEGNLTEMDREKNG